MLTSLFLPFTLSSQALERVDAPFFLSGYTEPLPLALVGGFNNPQPASLDLDGDGTQDLLVFDRNGHVVLPFLRVGDSWEFAPSYTASFPVLNNWVLVRDYNGDGIADLFTYSARPGVDGIRVFTGSYAEGRLAFQAFEVEVEGNLLTYALRSGGEVPIFVSSIDYPEVADMDCDGDLDILTFNVAGGYVEFMRNRSVEEGFGRDSLLFDLYENCWGGVYESGNSPEVDLSDAKGKCFGKEGFEPPVQVRHAGSTLLTIDIDADADLDLILGDLSFNNLNLLYNEGDCEEAWIADQDAMYPPSHPVDLPFFPVAFLADANMDGLADLLVAPNAEGDSENRDVLWLYENTATQGQAPQWSFVQKNWLIEGMIDLGEGLNPTFADVDQDGLTDIVAGNGYRFRAEGGRESSLHYYRNIGTSTAPEFEIEDENFLGMMAYNPNAYNYSPTFADLDDDGDLDLIVGEEQGGLFMAENVAGPNVPMSFAPWEYPYMGIDVGLGSAPTVADVNEDGLPDLIVGERNGNLNVFLNQGSQGSPFFNATPEEDFWGEVDTRKPGSLLGYSAPVVISQKEGLRLMTGSHEGNIEWYEIGENATFSMLEKEFGIVREGFRTRPALADLDDDGLLEMAVGNLRGGLALFETGLLSASSVSVSDKVQAIDFHLSPNPSSGQSVIHLPEAIREDGGRVRLFDATGRILQEFSLRPTGTPISTKGLPGGIYFVEVVVAEGRGVRRWIVY